MRVSSTRRSGLLGATVVVVVVSSLIAGVPQGPMTKQVQQYELSDEPIPNPDRGMSHYTQTRYAEDGSGHTPLDVWQLRRWKDEDQTTVIYRIVLLDGYRETDALPQKVLDDLDKDLDLLNAEGMKAILRFAYTEDGTADATPARTVGHIQQVAPVINDHRGVIHSLQAGFIGQWGEWYYSDNFASNPDSPWELTEEDWQNRQLVMTALETSIDARIPLQVRYPEIHRRLVSDERKDSVGIHNDCFVASESDMGTMNSDEDRAYIQQVSQHVPMTGETCAVDTGRSDDFGIVRSELERYSWAVLNADFSQDVLNSWGADNLREVETRLGYRYALTSASAPKTLAPSADGQLWVQVRNDGYAATGRHSRIVVTFSDESGQIVHSVPTDVELDSIRPGEHRYVPLPVQAPAGPGTYSLGVMVPDPDRDSAADLDQPAYSIQLANTGMWDAEQGVNDLGMQLVVE